MQEIVKKNYTIAKHFMDKISLFRYLTKREKNMLAYNTLLLKYDQGSVIFSEGDDANNFFVVESGQVEIRVKKKVPLLMKAGESFGENAFEDNQVRGGTAVAVENSSLLSIGRELMRKCLGRKLKDISFYNILKWSLSRDEILNKASPFQLQKIISFCQTRLYKDKEVICFEGDISKFLLVVLEGLVNEAEVGTIFHSEYLLAYNENDQRIDQRLVKYGDGAIGIIEFESIYKIFGYKLCELDNESIISRNTKEEMIKKNTKYLNSLSLGSLTVRSKVSEGRFENIYEVEDKYHKVYFLKCMKKREIMGAKMEGYLIK